MLDTLTESHGIEMISFTDHIADEVKICLKFTKFSLQLVDILVQNSFGQRGCFCDFYITSIVMYKCQ